MKRNGIISVFMASMMVLAGCGNNKNTASELPKGSDGRQIVTIGTSSISKDVLEVAAEDFNSKNKDYKVDVKVFDDAVTPDIATQDGTIQGTFHQYKSYMDNFNKDKNAQLKTYGREIFAFQIGLYSNKVKSLDEIKDGMKIAVSNDAANRALALKLLADNGIIKLKEGEGAPNILDIEENPKNLQFVEMERLNLANAVDDVDLAVVMSDVMKESGRDSDAALAYAQEEGIQLVIKEEGPWTKDLEESLASQKVKDYIINETKKSKIPLF